MKPLRVNADYEVELFHHKIAPPAVNQSIEFMLLFLKDNPLYSQKIYSPDYLNYVETITGHAPQIVNKGPYENYWGALKNKELEQWWNSKITSTELIIQKGWCADTHILKTADDLRLVNWNRDLLLKDPFGMSGQKFQLLRSQMPLRERHEICLKAFSQGSIIIEPWFQRKYDFSQYLFPDGKLIAYQNLVDDKFQYKGTVFNNLNSDSLKDLSFYPEISEDKWSAFHSQTQAIIDFYGQHPNEHGYSIDSFIYEEGGELHIRVMSEINYRRTMGRITYELAEKYANCNPWAALLMLKASSSPSWQVFAGMDGIMVLSPGDSRFEIIFLSAKNKDEGLKLIAKLKKLLPDTQLTIKL